MDGNRATPLSLLQFPFAAGIDESTRDELVETGAGWPVLENGRQDKRGGYSTRNGFEALGVLDYADARADVGGRLFADRDTVRRIANTNPTLEVYSPTSGRWRSLGYVPEAACSLTDLPGVGLFNYIEDVDATNGYLAVSWIASSDNASTGDVYVAILDESTGAVVRIPERIGTVGSTALMPPLLAVQGDYFILVRGTSGASSSITAWYLDTTSAATIATGWVAFGASLATDHSGGGYRLHSLPHASTARVALLYINDSAGASQLTLKTFTVAGGVLETQTVNTSSATPVACALGGNASDTLWVAWNETTAVKVRGLSPFAITATALASTATIMTMATGTDYIGIASYTTSSGHARIWANDTNATMQAAMRSLRTSGGAAVTNGSQITVPAVAMCRKPFVYAGRYYSAFYGTDAANTQRNIIVCDWSDDYTFLRPVANPTPGLATTGQFDCGKFVAGSTSSKVHSGIVYRRSGQSDGSALMTLDFASLTRWQTVAFGNSTYLSGGLASFCGGSSVSETGFLLRPLKPTVSMGGTGTTILTGWRYICVYEQVDDDGNWHLSGLSDPSDSTGPFTNKSVTVTTTPLAITSRMSTAAASARPVRVVYYRTLDGGNAPYYRLPSPKLNDTSSTTVGYADATTDAVLALNAKLYSQPGVIGTAQDKRPPPPFQAIVAYNGMLVGASGSDVWYSGQNVSGEGVWFNPIFQVPVPGEGPITGLWVTDGTLIVAKRRDLYAVTGEPPSDNGSSGGLGTPRRLAVDVGSIGPVHCTAALGTFFQSERGVELLTRAGTVDWIGAKVQDTVNSYPVCTAMTVDPASNTLLVELAASSADGLVSGNGRTPVYDLGLREWISTDRRTSAAGLETPPAADAPAQSACIIYTGSAYRYAWLAADATVCAETTSYLEPDGSFIAKRAVSANVKAGGPQGHQHVNKTLLLARYHTAHDLEMSFAYDYSPTYKTARLYTAAEIATVVAAIPNEQLEHGMHDDAACEAVRVQLEDVTPSSGTLGTGRGATWIALAFELVPQQGAYPLPDESR